MKQIEINDKLWDKISKFTKVISWNPHEFTEYILNMMIDFYCQATTKNNFDISEIIYHEFLENALLNELKVISE